MKWIDFEKLEHNVGLCEVNSHVWTLGGSVSPCRYELHQLHRIVVCVCTFYILNFVFCQLCIATYLCIRCTYYIYRYIDPSIYIPNWVKLPFSTNTFEGTLYVDCMLHAALKMCLRQGVNSSLTKTRHICLQCWMLWGETVPPKPICRTLVFSKQFNADQRDPDLEIPCFDTVCGMYVESGITFE